MTPGCVSQTDRGLALTPAATRICGRALPETCSFAAEGRDDGWAPRPATDPRALGRGPAAAAVCSEPGSARAPRDLPTLSPHPEAPRPARLGQEAQRAGGAAPGRSGASGAPHLCLRGRPRGAAALQCSLSPQVDFARGQRPYSCIYYFYDYRRSLSKCVQKGALFLQGTPPRPQLNRSQLSSQGQAGNRLHFPIYNPV